MLNWINRMRTRRDTTRTTRRSAFRTAADLIAYQRRHAYRHHHNQAGTDPTRFGDWEYNGRCTDFF